MTRLSVKALTLITLVFGISSQAAKADVDLTDGIRAFICEGKTLVLEETDESWVTSSGIELSNTINGWRWDADGSVYLSEREPREWVVELLSPKGYRKSECIDITASTAEVISVIKSRLNENIEKIETETVAAKEQVNKLRQKTSKLSLQNSELENKLVVALAEKNDLTNKLSAYQSEVAVLNSKITAELIAPNIKTCWNINSLTPLAFKKSVIVAFTLLEGGKPLVSTIRLKTPESGTDSVSEEVFETARRAIIRCGARGFLMPDRVASSVDVSLKFYPKVFSITAVPWR